MLARTDAPDGNFSVRRILRPQARWQDQWRERSADSGLEKAAFPGDVKWNFGQFLIDKDGKPIVRFEPTTVPDSPEIAAAVEKALTE